MEFLFFIDRRIFKVINLPSVFYRVSDIFARIKILDKIDLGKVE